MTQIYQKIEKQNKFASFFRKIIVPVVFLVITITASAQNQSVVIDDGKISIKQAFQKIETQTGYSFGYDDSTIDLSQRITIPTTQAALKEMLDTILKDTGYGYTIRGKSILIAKQNEKSTDINTAKMPIITRGIKGLVVDDHTGSPIAGAVIGVSGAMATEATTDHAGRFEIEKMPVGNQRLRIFKEGYFLSERTVVIAQNDNATLDIRLKSITQYNGSIRSSADKGGIETEDSLVPTENKGSEERFIPKSVTFPYDGTERKYTTRYNSGRRWDNKVALKTNLLYLATMSPNIGIEFKIAPKLSVEVMAGFNMFEFKDIFEKGYNTSLRHWLVQPELRYWTCRTFNGHFFGVHGLYGQYNVGEIPFFSNGLKHNMYDGKAYGAGISYGYQWILSKHLNLEATIGAGYVRFDHEVLSLDGECKTCLDKKTTRNYFGPTKAGLSLIYIF